MMTFIPVAAPVIGERELAYVTDAVRSGWVSSLGPYIERFERAFADYVGVSHAVAVSNGTVGLHLALHALGIGSGDEVLVPDLTFVATAHAVLQTGATPVFVDVEPDTWCIDPLAAKRAITPRTRAMIPVHLYGHPADMDAIQRLADEHRLLVIEDAAEAHGAEYRSRRVGSIGIAGVFSFYGNKIITTGEGGMVTTNDTALAARLRFLKDHGMHPEQRYYHTELAFNYRLTNIQAALGLAQLEQIETFIERRRQIFRWYAEDLATLPGIRLNVERPGTRNVYWMSSLVLTDDCHTTRQELADNLRLQGIDSRPFFVPMHQLPHLARYRTVGHDGDGCPQAERLGARGLNLPSSCNLDEVVVRQIVSTIVQIVSGHANQGSSVG
jgi:perosamine synthetase